MLAGIEKLVITLSSPDATQRLAAAEALAGMGEEGQQAAIALVDACGSKDSQVQEWSVAALEQLGPPRTEDVDDLMGRIAGKEELVDFWAITLLGRLGSDGAPAAACLGETLANSPYPSVCQRAAWALRELGASALPAKVSLQNAADNRLEPRLSRLAQEALTQIQK